MRHPVRFQQKAQMPDGSGGFMETWQDLEAHAEDFARIEALSARAVLAYGQLQTAATHRLFVRWRGDVEPRMRIVATDGIYEIVSALDRDGTRAWLEIIALKES